MIVYRGKSYSPLEFLYACKLKFWNWFCGKVHYYRFYPYLYRSTWHALFFPVKNPPEIKNCYYTAVPSSGAGIGHQLANWNAGLFYSKKFGVPYAHTSLSNSKWEKFFGFNEQLPLAADLLANEGFKKRKLPFFLWRGDSKIELNQKIINSYAKKKVLLVAESNQHYKAQTGNIKELKCFFNNASARKQEKLEYNRNYFNIAVHVRRTVVIDSKVIVENDENRKKRWLPDDYYFQVISCLIEAGKFPQPIRLYVFSTNELEEFKCLEERFEVFFCHEWDEYTSFLHLVKADLLITSKSSFSYKAALFSDGYIISPKHFWHDYPDSSKWIIAENSGKIKQGSLDFS